MLFLYNPILTPFSLHQFSPYPGKCSVSEVQASVAK